MENIADYFYEKLSDDKDIGKILTQMFLQIFESAPRDNYRSYIININRAIKVYGKYNVYFALLAISNMDVNFSKPIYPLLSAVILRKIRDEGRASGQSISQFFDKDINATKKKIKQALENPIELENPFDEWY